MSDKVNRRADFFDRAARQEVRLSPEVVQLTHQRRMPSIVFVLFEVQATGTGDGVYKCYKQTLIEFEDTTGKDKMEDVDETEYEVLHLVENDPRSDNHVPALGKYDRIAAWRVQDKDKVLRWVGFSLTPSIRLFKTIENAPASDHITCNMILNNGVEAASGELGYNVEVYGNFSIGTNYDTSARRLQSGDYLCAVNIRGQWRTAEGFNKTKQPCNCYTS